MPDSPQIDSPSTDCPLIELSGPPHARGVSYGRQAAGRIRKGAAFYAGQIGAAGLDAAGMADLVAEYLPVIERFEPRYIEEMRGIAQGAEVPFADIVLLNARTEILKLAQRPDLRARLAHAAEPDGCTGLFALPEATRDNEVIHAQNWDWRAQCAETAVVLRIRNDDGPDMLAFTEAGGLARSGLNAAGIAITANYLESDRDYTQAGVPLALIRRKVLEQGSLALAMHAIYCTPKSASNNMMITQADGMGAGLGIDFECAPDETFQVHPDRGLLVHANHWQSPVALAKLRDTGIASTPDSLYRDLRVRALLDPHRGAITTAHVKAALFDDYQTPWSVCRPPRPGIGGGISATVAMLVMQPAAGILDIAMLPASNRAFTRFTLEPAQARAAAE